MRRVILICMILVTSIAMHYPETITNKVQIKRATMEMLQSTRQGNIHDTAANLAQTASITNRSNLVRRHVTDLLSRCHRCISRLLRRGLLPAQTKKLKEQTSDPSPDKANVPSPSQTPASFTRLTDSVKEFGKAMVQGGQTGSESEKKAPNQLGSSSFMRPLHMGAQRLFNYKTRARAGIEYLVKNPKTNPAPGIRKSRSMSSGTLNELAKNRKSLRKSRNPISASSSRKPSKSRHGFDGGDRPLEQTSNPESQSIDADERMKQIMALSAKETKTSPSAAQKDPAVPTSGTAATASGMSKNRDDTSRREPGSILKEVDPEQGKDSKLKKSRRKSATVPSRLGTKAVASDARLSEWLDQSVKTARQDLPNHLRSKSWSSSHSDSREAVNSDSPNSIRKANIFSQGPTTADVIPIPEKLSRLKTEGDWTNGAYEKLEDETWGGKDFEGPMFSPYWDGPTPRPLKSKRPSKPPGLPKAP